MSGMFIDVTVESSAADDAAVAKKLEEVCPVGIFSAANGKLRIVEESTNQSGYLWVLDLAQDLAHAGPELLHVGVGSAKELRQIDRGLIDGTNRIHDELVRSLVTLHPTLETNESALG